MGPSGSHLLVCLIRKLPSRIIGFAVRARTRVLDPMPRLFNRIVALLTALCLILDSAWAVSPNTHQALPANPAFSEQALAPMAELMHRLPFASAFQGRHVINQMQESHAISRRGFFALISAPLGTQPARPGDEQGEKVRQDIFTLFRQKNNFREEIDWMYDHNMIAPDAGISREDMHDAMQRFLRFIRQAKMESMPSERSRSFGATVNLGINCFQYSPNDWDEIMRDHFDTLFHEATHLARPQQVWYDQAFAAGQVIIKTIRRHEAIGKDAVQANSQLREANRTLTSYSWKSEIQANYVEVAFNMMRARRANVTLEELVRNWSDAETVLSLAKKYDPSTVSPVFMEVILVRYLLLPDRARDLVLLTPNTEMENIITRLADSSRQNWTAAELTQFLSWAFATYLTMPTPLVEKPAPGWAGQLLIPGAITGGILGALAFWRWRRISNRPVSRQVARSEARRRQPKRRTSHGPGTPAADQPMDTNLDSLLRNVESIITELNQSVAASSRHILLELLQERVSGLVRYLTAPVNVVEVDQHTVRLASVRSALQTVSPELANLLPPAAPAASTLILGKTPASTLLGPGPWSATFSRFLPMSIRLPFIAAAFGLQVNKNTKYALLIGGVQVWTPGRWSLYHRCVAGAEAMRINVVEIPYFVRDASEIPRVLSELRKNPRLVGAVVTAPWKKEVLSHINATFRSPEAEMAQATNLVWKDEDGQLHADSNDGAAWADLCEKDFGIPLTGKRIVILGAGSAGREIALALSGKGIKQLTISEKNTDTIQLARQLLHRLELAGSVLDPDKEPGKLRKVLQGADIVINATDVGMTGTGTEKKVPVDPQWIPNSADVFDIILTPEQTPLLKRIKEQGGKTHVEGARFMTIRTGLFLLVASFTSINKRPPTGTEIDQALQAMRSVPLPSENDANQAFKARCFAITQLLFFKN